MKYQTDDTPFHTSIGHHVHAFGCAVSPDLLSSGEICYGDALQIPGFGIRVVNDVTHPRLIKTVDIWVATKTEEKRVGKRMKQQITIIKSETRKCRK